GQAACLYDGDPLLFAAREVGRPMPTDLHPEFYRASTLIDFAERLFCAVGCEADKSRAIAEHLVDADLMGHTTHGLAQVGSYLEELESGTMRKMGAPRILADCGAALTWDGAYLPGIWLTDQALETASERAREHGLAAVAIRRSHHIGCLSVYLR